MTKPLMEPGMLSALWARLVGGTPATGKVPTRQADGSVAWQTPSGGGGGGSDRSAVTALSISSGVVTLDCDAGDFFTLDLTEDATLVISNPPTSIVGRRIVCWIVQGASWTLDFPATFAWPLTVAGVVSSTAGARDVLMIDSLDGGTTWAADLRKSVIRPDEVLPFDLLTLFDAGAVGYLLDIAASWGGLYTDTGGTTPVTTAGNPVKQWEDTSGNGHDFTEATNAPVAAIEDGYDCVYFDGLNDLLSSAVAGSLSGTTEIFVAIKILETGTYPLGYNGTFEYFCVSQSGSASSTRDNCGIPVYLVNGADVPGGVGTTRDQLFDAIPLNTWIVLEVRNLTIGSWSALKFGAYPGSELECFMAAMVCCETQDDATRAAIRRVLGAKVGLAI